MKIVLLGLVVATVAAISCLLDTRVTHAASPIERLRKNDEVLCGLRDGRHAFSHRDRLGEWRGRDVEICRQIAQFALGDSSKVRFVDLPLDRMAFALRSGEVDVLVGATHRLTTELKLPRLTLAHKTFDDGLSALVPRRTAASRIDDLKSPFVCLFESAFEEQLVQGALDRLKLRYLVLSFRTHQDLYRAYADGKCDVVFDYRSDLIREQSLLVDPEAHLLLPDQISSEPLGVVVRSTEAGWYSSIPILGAH
jgi:general L-amino acid transport system substrate-binding protein